MPNYLDGLSRNGIRSTTRASMSTAPHIPQSLQSEMLLPVESALLGCVGPAASQGCLPIVWIRRFLERPERGRPRIKAWVICVNNMTFGSGMLHSFLLRWRSDLRSSSPSAYNRSRHYPAGGNAKSFPIVARRFDQEVPSSQAGIRLSRMWYYMGYLTPT